jgi:ribonuclease VapC
MIVDSSAVVAICTDEPGAADLLATAWSADHLQMSAPTLVETGIVIDQRSQRLASRRLDNLLAALAVRIAPFTEGQAKIARQAYRDYGRGSGHPARLNFGDCFAYALAIETDEPLLYQGEDFAHTDVRAAIRPA